MALFHAGRMNMKARLLQMARSLASFADAGVLPDDIDEPTTELKGVEIFRAGDYGPKGEYTEADIQDMAAHWNDGGHEPPVTLDHAEHGPAYGFISRCWAEGGRLFADLRDVPKRLADAIRKRRYPKRSIEFYRDWKGRGVASIRRVTFLGAVPPGVPGMEEVKCSDAPSFAVFADIAEPPVQIEFADTSPEQFRDVPPDPAPDSHGVLTRTDPVQANVGHCHDAYLDDDGNGYTSYPTSCYWSEDQAPIAKHVHLVKGGVIQPAGEPLHTHDIVLSQSTKGAVSMSDTNTAPADETKPKENAQDMTASPATPAPPAAIVTPEQFADLQKRVAELEQQNKALAERNENAEKQAREIFEESLRRERLRRFGDVFAECLEKGQVTQSEREALEKTYLNLCRLDTMPERFSDDPKETDPSAEFLASLKARPQQVPVGVMFADANPPKVTGGDTGHPKERENERLRAKAREYQEKMAAQGKLIAFSDALIEASRVSA